MENKNAKIYLWTALALGVIILLAVWLGTPVDEDRLGVQLSAGSEPGTVLLENTKDSYQYSIDNGQSWINIDGLEVDNIAADIGDVILVRDIDVIGLADDYTVTADTFTE